MGLPIHILFLVVLGDIGRKILFKKSKTSCKIFFWDGLQHIRFFRKLFYITPCVKCGITHASRAEIHIFTPREIKFRTILVRKTFSWWVWLHHSPSARAANSHSSENVSSHSCRNVLSPKNPNIGVKKPETSILTWFVPTLQKVEK